MAYKEISRAPRNQSQLNLLNYRQEQIIIIKPLQVFLQNVQNNKLLTDTIFENKKELQYLVYLEIFLVNYLTTSKFYV